MIGEKERKLLEYMYEQQNNLLDYMQRNGIKDVIVSSYIIPNKTDEKGESYDAVNVDLHTCDDEGNVKRILTCRYNHVTGRRQFSEHLYE